MSNGDELDVFVLTRIYFTKTQILTVIRLGSALIYLYLVVYSHGLWSQDLEIRRYSTLDGLTSNLINYCYQDQFGYFWIGSIHGLQRFDGNNFESFGVQNGMPSLFCIQMFEDHTGRIWVATRKGMAEFRKDSFYIYPTSDHSQPTYVFKIYENRQNQLIANTLEGQYWFTGEAWAPYHGVGMQNREPVTQVVKTDEGNTQLHLPNYSTRIMRVISNCFCVILVKAHIL